MSKASIWALIEAGSFRKRFTQLVLFLRFGFRGGIVSGISFSCLIALHRYTFFNTPNFALRRRCHNG